MIKRRFYKVDLGDGDNASDSSSSSSSGSDSLPDEGVEKEEENVEEEITSPPNGGVQPLSPSSGSGSGYQSEDSSGNEVNCDSSGLPINDDDESCEEGGLDFENRQLHSKNRIKTSDKRVLDSLTRSLSPKGPNEDELDDCVLRCKSVFKCRLCPRIICLNKNTLKAHLQSKRHARSKKLLDEGRLKLMLNSDGEIEEDQETHAERHARMIAIAEELAKPKKPVKGQKRLRNRLNNEEKNIRSGEAGAEQLAKAPGKKRRKVKD